MHKYKIVLFCNKKEHKVLRKCMKKSTIYEHWRIFKTSKKPSFVKLQGSKRNEEKIYELALIFPNTRWSTKAYVKDSLSRNIEAVLEDNKYRIKEIIPYWEEELIYDFQIKKRVRYHEVLNKFLEVKEIAQIFTLNNKLFLQIEDNIQLFGNKNIKDSERLFNIIKDDLLNRKRSNFIFVRDITTHQRKILYKLLEAKGFKKSELFRHYSY